VVEVISFQRDPVRRQFGRVAASAISCLTVLLALSIRFPGWCPLWWGTACSRGSAAPCSPR